MPRSGRPRCRRSTSRPRWEGAWMPHDAGGTPRRPGPVRDAPVEPLLARWPGPPGGSELVEQGRPRRPLQVVLGAVDEERLTGRGGAGHDVAAPAEAEHGPV